MEKQAGDQPVLNNTERVVAEDHRLHEAGARRKTDRRGSRKSRSSCISAGTSCASAMSPRRRA